MDRECQGNKNKQSGSFVAPGGGDEKIAREAAEILIDKLENRLKREGFVTGMVRGVEDATGVIMAAIRKAKASEND